MKLKDLVKVLKGHTVLDISAIKKNHCETFSSRVDELPRKYLDYYVGYVCPETMRLSFCSQKYESDTNTTCLLLDIYKDELEADHAISMMP